MPTFSPGLSALMCLDSGGGEGVRSQGSRCRATSVKRLVRVFRPILTSSRQTPCSLIRRPPTSRGPAQRSIASPPACSPRTFAKCKAFYVDLFGFDTIIDIGWFVSLHANERSLGLSLCQRDHSSILRLSTISDRRRARAGCARRRCRGSPTPRGRRAAWSWHYATSPGDNATSSLRATSCPHRHDPDDPAISARMADDVLV